MYYLTITTNVVESISNIDEILNISFSSFMTFFWCLKAFLQNRMSIQVK